MPLPSQFFRKGLETLYNGAAATDVGPRKDGRTGQVFANEVEEEQRVLRRATIVFQALPKGNSGTNGMMSMVLAALSRQHRRGVRLLLLLLLNVVINVVVVVVPSHHGTNEADMIIVIRPQ